MGPTGRAGSSYTHISTATTTPIAGAKVLRRVVITESVANTIVVNDGTGATVASFVASAPVGGYEFDVTVRGGLSVVTGGASKLTVVWD